MPLSRRRFVASAAMLGVPASAIRAQTALTPTPGMTEGPFYPQAFTPEPQIKLVRGPLQGDASALVLSGRVVDRFGKPVEAARVEIWQCDALGHYTHPRDSRAAGRDPNFAGFGWTRTDASGGYTFETIRPAPYPGRTPHIHFAVRAPQLSRLVTQMFVEGVAQNQNDFLYTSMTQVQRQLVTARLEAARQGQRARFDLVLG